MYFIFWSCCGLGNEISFTLPYKVYCSLEFFSFASSRQSSSHFRKSGLGHTRCFLRLLMVIPKFFWHTNVYEINLPAIPTPCLIFVHDSTADVRLRNVGDLWLMLRLLWWNSFSKAPAKFGGESVQFDRDWIWPAPSAVHCLEDVYNNRTVL